MAFCMGCMHTIEEEGRVCAHCGYVKGTPPKEAYHMMPETILQGRYIIGRTLGFGGFGVTYLGWDAQLERKVAVKEFLPSTFATRMPGNTAITVYAGEATEQFEAGLVKFVEEAQRLARFNRIPGIVDIYDTFAENNTGYIIMQYLEGTDVKEMLKANGPMLYEQALPIIRNVGETLAEVHKEGIIHRDISPDNIFITKSGEIKLLDFGAARYATTFNSKSLSVILKAGYAPEEQYRSRGEQGPWSDVYALAATFYKMLTGVTPEDSMERAIKDELEEPSKLGVTLPKNAEIAILNALNIRKADRTQSVDAFLAALQDEHVTRQKATTQKTDTGQLSKGLKIALAVGGCGVLVLGLLVATGVLNGSRFLPSTYDSSLPKGMVYAPGVVNLNVKDAEKTIKKVGLKLQITGKEFSEKVVRDKIFMQTPLPGVSLEAGAVIEVQVSAGRKADALEQEEKAMASGKFVLPDVQYKYYEEALTAIWDAQRETLPERGQYPVYVDYVYDDTVQKGLVISCEIREKNEEEKTWAELDWTDQKQVIGMLVSAGPGDETVLPNFAFSNYYVGRAQHGHEEFGLRLDGPRDRHDESMFYFEASGDNGATWNTMGGNISVEMPFASAMIYPNGSTVRIRARALPREGVYKKESTYEVEVPLKVYSNAPPIQLTSIEWLDSQSKIDKALEGYVEDDPYVNEMPYVYRLKGNFKKDTQYMMCQYQGSQNDTIWCQKDGEIILRMWGEIPQKEEGWEDDYLPLLSAYVSGEVLEDGTGVLTVSKPIALEYKP